MKGRRKLAWRDRGRGDRKAVVRLPFDLSRSGFSEMAVLFWDEDRQRRGGDSLSPATSGEATGDEPVRAALATGARKTMRKRKRWG